MSRRSRPVFRAAAVALTLAGTAGCMLSRTRVLDPLSPAERSTAVALRTHVEAIAAEPHNLEHYPALQRAASYIDGRFSAAGYAATRQTFQVGAMQAANIEAEVQGQRHPERIVVIGAHYDS